MPFLTSALIIYAVPASRESRFTVSPSGISECFSVSPLPFIIAGVIHTEKRTGISEMIEQSPDKLIFFVRCGSRQIAPSFFAEGFRFLPGIHISLKPVNIIVMSVKLLRPRRDSRFTELPGLMSEIRADLQVRHERFRLHPDREFLRLRRILQIPEGKRILPCLQIQPYRLF